jgi:AcrR family transcriptional regulator
VARPPNPEARSAMILAARRAFAEVGVDATRVEDVARAAGLSKASFYVYFHSKDALFRELVSAFFADCQQCADERHLAAQELSLRIGPCEAFDWAQRTERFQRFSALEHTYTLRTLQILWNWRDMLKCLLDHSNHDQRELVDGLVVAMLETLTGRLAEAMRSGFLRRDIDPELASEVLIGAYLQLGRKMFRLNEPPDFERWAHTVESILNEGLRPRDEGVAR